MNGTVPGHASRLSLGASRPRIHRGRDARAGSRDGCPTTQRQRQVPGPNACEKTTGAFHGARPSALAAMKRGP